MRLDLYQYIEGDNTAEAGDFIGHISLEEDDISINLDDDGLAEELEQLFSEPLKAGDGLLSDEEDDIEPYTSDFFRRVIPLLPDYGIRGVLKGDEDSREYRKTEEPDEVESEEMEQMGSEMLMDDLADDYEEGEKEEELYDNFDEGGDDDEEEDYQ